MVADPTTQQPDLASLLGQSQRPQLGDILGLLQEMRARRESASKQSASPLAELLGGLVGQGGVSSGGDYKSALGGIIAAMEQDKLRRNMIGDLQSGKLAPLNQLQQQNGPQDTGFLGDLQQLGIGPDDFRAILGLKAPTSVAPNPNTIPINGAAPMGINPATGASASIPEGSGMGPVNPHPMAPGDSSTMTNQVYGQAPTLPEGWFQAIVDAKLNPKKKKF